MGKTKIEGHRWNKQGTQPKMGLRTRYSKNNR